MTSRIRMYGEKGCDDCARAKAFFARHGVEYDWFDIDEDSEALDVLLEANGGVRITPTIFFPDGTVLAEPSDDELARALGLPIRS